MGKGKFFQLRIWMSQRGSSRLGSDFLSIVATVCLWCYCSLPAACRGEGCSVVDVVVVTVVGLLI